MFKRLRHRIHWRECPIVDRWGVDGNPHVVITRFTCGHKDIRMGTPYDAIGAFNDGVRSNDRCGIDGCVLWSGHDGADFNMSDLLGVLNRKNDALRYAASFLKIHKPDRTYPYFTEWEGAVEQIEKAESL